MSISIEDAYKQRSELDNLSFEPIEALERLKISRGYYATFLSARAIIEKHKIPMVVRKSNGDKYGSHEKIYESLVLYTISPNLVEVGLQLRNYHKLRKKADYDIHKNITEYDVDLARSYFEACRKRIEFFEKNPTLPYTKASKVVEATHTGSGIGESKISDVIK